MPHDEFLQEFAASARTALNRRNDEAMGVGRFNTIDVLLKKAESDLWVPVSHSHNSRVNAGALLVAQLIGSAAGTPANYMALSSATLTPALGDTTLTGEITTNGLARKLATYGGYTAPTALNGTASFTLTAAYTYTGSVAVNIVSGALFNAATAGSMLSEGNLSAPATVNANGDQVTVVWTITV